MKNSANSKTTLNVNSNLELDNIEVNEIPKDILFPDELNRYLREQIHYLKHENGMLKKNLSEQETIADQNCKKIKEYEESLKNYEATTQKNEFVSSTQLASTKIVELTKKLREKTAELECWKTKCSKLEAVTISLKEKFENNEPAANVPPPPQETTENVSEDQIKKLQEKLNFTTNKLHEQRNANLQLKNDLKLANKWLQQEIGDGFEAMLVNNSNSNWRGRAQIICDLQQKNNELRDRLKQIQDKSSVKVESKISLLSKENLEFKGNLDEMKKKFDTLNAKWKVLNTDYSLLKSKFNILCEQGERDKSIIENLTSQASYNRDAKNDILKQRERLLKKYKTDNVNLMAELTKCKCKLQNAEEVLEMRNKEIDDLKQKNNYNFTWESNTNKDEENLIGRLEVEKMRLLELMDIQNKRLQTERDVHMQTKNLLRFEKQRAAKLEATVARLELDQNSSRTSNYGSTSSKAEDSLARLKNKLELAEENIKALQTRLEMEKREKRADLLEFSKILEEHNNKK